MPASQKQTCLQPWVNRSPVTRALNYSSQDKMDKTHLQFTRSHGGASWDEPGLWRGAFPTPGTRSCWHAPAYPIQVTTMPGPAA